MSLYNDTLLRIPIGRFVFFFNDTATTEIYTLSLHDALPISRSDASSVRSLAANPQAPLWTTRKPNPRSEVRVTDSTAPSLDRKSTRLNSSHSQISYAVFCLKKKTTLSHVTHHTRPVCA